MNYNYYSTAVGILVIAIWSNTYVYAQQSSPTSPSSASMPSSPSVAKVKITSPTRGQQVPAGKDLTISGTSIDNATSSNNDCKVSVIANKVRPYQPATATGTGGAADYSKWKFDITSKYTTIKPGQNRITAKYECGNNAASTSFSSVNVIGVQQQGTGITAGTIATNKSTTTITPTITTTSTAAKTQISSSSSRQQQTTTPKLTTTATASVAAAPKQQQIASTNNTTNTISRTTNAATRITMAPISNPTTNASSSSLSLLSSMAPQVKSVNQQQQQQEQPQLLPTIRNDRAGQNYTGINSTAGQNDAFLATPPVVASGKLMYLGYHGGDTIPTNGDSSPNDKSSSATDSDSTGRKKISSGTRSDRTDSTSDDGNSKDKVSSDTKPHTPHTVINTNDDSNSKGNDDSSDIKSSSHNDDSSKSSSHYASSNDSTEKKKANSTKLDRADSTNGQSSSKKDNSSTSDSRSFRRTNDGIETLSSSDFASASRHSLFGFSDYGF